MPEVLLTGVSMRAAAQSAVRAGYHPHTIDAFADLDVPKPKTHVSTTVTGRRFDPRLVLQTARRIPVDAIVYGSGFEDDSPAVDEISRGRTLWGNPPDVLRQVRSPRRLLEGLAQRGFAVPRVFVPGDDAGEPAHDVEWIEKPFRSGGGHGVRPWHPGLAFAEGSYLEEFIHGSPGSIVFVASGGRSVPLGVSRQLAGDAAFGGGGVQY